MGQENKEHSLSNPPFYFPLESGCYEVKPGLYKFPHDFDSPEQDQKVFQIDNTFPSYRKQKLTARNEQLSKYYCQRNFTTEDMSTINSFIIRRLVEENSSFFEETQLKNYTVLRSRLTGESLYFSPDYLFEKYAPGNTVKPGYRDGFDALVCQIQEDMSVLKLDNSANDQIVALHLCFPNHWAAEKKIGQNFVQTHQYVPHIDQINQSSRQLIQALLHKGPFVRFAWGIASDARLNHHPEPPNESKPADWFGRNFNPAKPDLYLRVERQTLHGFPEEQLGLFTIRTYVYDIKMIASEHPSKIPLLISAIESMSDQSLMYKGLASSKKEILNWLGG